MRRLLAALLVLIAVAVGYVLFSDPGPAEEVTLPPDEQVEAPAGPAPATLDSEGLRAEREVEKDEPFDPRGLKVGAGDYGMHGTVVDEGGQPVPNAWVAAYSMPFPLMDFEFQMEEILDAPLELSLEPLASVQADAEGKFALEGLFGRATYLVARADKRLTRGRQLVEAAELDREKGVLLHTVAGAALDGIVRDENGAPVADAEVFVLPSPMYALQAFRNRDIYVERVYTDGSGRFSIDAVPAGAKLMALAFDGATHPGMREFGPLLPRTAKQLDVPLMPTGTLEGKVIDEEGAPVRGAKLVAAPLDFRLILPFVRDMGAWVTESDAGGRWKFDELPMRQYLVIAQGREGRSPLYANRVTGSGTLAAEDIVVRSKQRIDGRVLDLRGQPIAGARIALKSIPSKEGGGRGMENGGMPDAATIFREIAQEVAPELLPAETYAVSGPDGKFSLAAWKGARLSVEADGFPESVFRADFEEDKSPILVLMRPGGVTGKVADSEGKPVKFFVISSDQRGSALQPAESVARADEEPWDQYRERQRQAERDYRDSLLADVRGDDEVLLLPEMPALAELRNLRFHDDGTGQFALEGLMPGEWRVEARAEGYEVGARETVTVVEGEVTEDVVITMSRGATVRGHVLAAGTREPVAGAVVTIGRGREAGFQAYLQMGFDTTAVTRSDADGGFELRGVDEDMGWVHAVSEGFAPASVQIEELVEGETREGVVVEVVLGGTIEGRVYDRNGNPLPGRMVAGMAPDSQDFWQAPTDADGYYRAEHVKAGNYFVVSAALDDDALFTGDFLSVLGGARLAQALVRDGQTVTVDIEDLAAGGCKVRGKVVSGGEPVRGAAVFAMATDTAGIFDFRVATARTDEEGEFDFGEMAPGEYLAQIQSRDWQGSIEFFVDDIPEDYQILEAPRGVVSGRVIHETTGDPVEGAAVSLRRDDRSGGIFSGMFGGGGAGTQWETTDARGEYSFDGVSPGEYHVEVQMSRWGGFDGNEDATPLGRAESRRFDMSENQTRRVDDIALPIAAVIVVTVTDADGKPFERGFSLEAEPADGDAEPVNSWGWNGRGTLSGVGEGTWDVSVQADGYAAVRSPGVQVRAGERTEIAVQLVQGAKLSVRMLDPNGQPLGGADLQVLDAEGKRVSRRGIAAFAAFAGGSEGAVPVGTYAPGSYTVVVEWQGQRQERPMRMRRGEDQTVEIRF